MALSKENAIQEWRDFMGATNPEKATVGTLRKMFGENISYNATHGSDAVDTARRELKQLFNV
jgi:nucleoside-diphosphate kinase